MKEKGNLKETERIAKLIFLVYDTDKDGILTHEEYWNLSKDLRSFYQIGKLQQQNDDENKNSLTTEYGMMDLIDGDNVPMEAWLKVARTHNKVSSRILTLPNVSEK